MSDAIGRFKTYFISMVLQLICGVVIAVAPHIAIYSVARLAIGATCSGSDQKKKLIVVKFFLFYHEDLEKRGEVCCVVV